MQTIHNNPINRSSNESNVSQASRADDFYATRPASLPQSSTVGRTNAHLAALKDLRKNPQMLEKKLIDGLDEFYIDADIQQTNRQFLRSKGFEVSSANSSQKDLCALERTASFATIETPLESLGAAIAQAIEDQNPATSILAVNAIVTAVKSQIENLNSVALENARNGDRICPMTLNPTHFNNFLRVNNDTLQALVQNCSQPVATRDQAVLPHLQRLADIYFSFSRNYPGAPQSMPHDVKVHMGTARQSRCESSLFGKKTVHLSIDSQGLDAFCRNPLPVLDREGTDQGIFYSHLMTGFEHHSTPKKLAAMYLQLMLHEASEIQEHMGSKSAFKSAHIPAAQRAGHYTMNEMHYEGASSLGDQTRNVGNSPSQRNRTSIAMRFIPSVSREYQTLNGTPLITDQKLQDWIQSAAFYMDMRSLTEPSARLLLQRAPINAQSLLRTPALS